MPYNGYMINNKRVSDKAIYKSVKNRNKHNKLTTITSSIVIGVFIFLLILLAAFSSKVHARDVQVSQVEEQFIPPLLNMYFIFSKEYKDKPPSDAWYSEDLKSAMRSITDQDVSTARKAFTFVIENKVQYITDIHNELQEFSKNAVGMRLRDHYSAQYKFLGANRFNNTFVVCGVVNARNGYGGYVGYKPFTVIYMYDNNAALPAMIGVDAESFFDKGWCNNFVKD